MFFLYFLAMILCLILCRAWFTPIMMVIWFGVTFTMTAILYILEVKPGGKGDG